MTTTDFTDPRPVYHRASEQAARLISTVRPDQLALPTACTEFDVRGLLEHVVNGTRGIAAIPGGAAPAPGGRAAGKVSDDGWGAAYDEVRTLMLKAWDDDELMTRAVRVPWGEVPGHAALAGYVMEIVAHTWDLSDALGHPFPLDPEVGAFALAVAERQLPESRPREVLPFGERRDAPEGADAYGRLAAWLGRTPVSRA
ncbi:TIGR03086 family metal-binding protein [Streptomyces sp. NPDC004682]